MRRRSGPLLVLAVLICASCAIKPKPPLVNLWERNPVGVCPAGSDPADPALAADLARALREALGGLVAAAKVLDADAPPPPVPPGPSASPWLDPVWRGEAAARCRGCELLLAVSVSEFRESSDADAPKRIRSQVDASWKWGVTDIATAHCVATLALVEPGTGAVIWTRRLPGDGKDSRWTELPWAGDRAAGPPAGWDEVLAKIRPAQPATGPRYAADTSAARAREKAIAEIVRAALVDFNGRDGWEPPARP